MDSSAPSPTSPQQIEQSQVPRETSSAASWHAEPARPDSRLSASEGHLNKEYSFPPMHAGAGHAVKASAGNTDQMRSNTTSPTYRFPSMSADNLVAATASMEPGSSAFLHAHPFGMHIPVNNSFDGNDSGYASSNAPYSSNSQYIPSLDHTYGSASTSSHNTSPTHPSFSASGYGTSSMRTSEPSYYDERPGAAPMDARIPTIAVSGNSGYPARHYPEYLPQSDEFSPVVPNGANSAYAEPSRSQLGKSSDRTYFQFPAHRPPYANSHNMPPLKTHSGALDSQSNPNFAVHYHQSHSTTTHTTSSSSTYIPNSAYIPSKSSFNGFSPSAASPAPKSAPSTPLGRQDARFLSSRGWATPQPLQPPMFAGQHNILASPLPGGPINGNGGGAIMHDGPLMSPFPDEYSQVYMNHNGSAAGQYTLPGSPYIPYARVKATKRQSVGYSKGESPKRSKKQERMSPQTPEIPASGLGLSESPIDIDVKPRTQRCKIACSACRKTRLRCDGNVPCTSCVDKYLKINTMATTDDAAMYIAAHGSCQYENFVRRRGKGKKTLEREREDTILRHHMRDSSILSGPPEFQMIHAVQC